MRSDTVIIGRASRVEQKADRIGLFRIVVAMVTIMEQGSDSLFGREIS